MCGNVAYQLRDPADNLKDAEDGHEASKGDFLLLGAGIDKRRRLFAAAISALTFGRRHESAAGRALLANENGATRTGRIRHRSRERDAVPVVVSRPMVVRFSRPPPGHRQPSSGALLHPVERQDDGQVAANDAQTHGQACTDRHSFPFVHLSTNDTALYSLSFSHLSS